MHKYLFLFLLFWGNTGNSSAQWCVDSSRIDTYFPCFDGFNPVCGCNAKNYRSPCAAEHWGGISTYVSGVCDNFEIDFVPNPVVNYPGEFSVFVKNPGTVTIQMYDMFGKILFTYNYYTTFPNEKIGPYTLSFAGQQNGIYNFVVSVAGERKFRKILYIIE